MSYFSILRYDPYKTEVWYTQHDDGTITREFKGPKFATVPVSGFLRHEAKSQVFGLWIIPFTRNVWSDEYRAVPRGMVHAWVWWTLSFGLARFNDWFKYRVFFRCLFKFNALDTPIYRYPVRSDIRLPGKGRRVPE